MTEHTLNGDMNTVSRLDCGRPFFFFFFIRVNTADGVMENLAKKSPYLVRPENLWGRRKNPFGNPRH